MNAFLKNLQTCPRRRVQLDEIRRHFYAAFPEVQDSPHRGAQLLKSLQELEITGHLRLPARGSWERLGQPPLPLWITLSGAQPQAERRDYGTIAWAPELDFWPQLKAPQLEALMPVNDFLLGRRGLLPLVPAKERSLEIFGDEKRLERISQSGMLFGKLPLSALSCFQVSAPLPYRPGAAPGRPALVLENKDAYWSFGEWNTKSNYFSAVVYGGGEAFQSTGAALAQMMHEVGAGHALYFGDLDPKGIRIPLEFNRKTELGQPQVSPAVELYAWLVSNGVCRAKPECTEAPSDLASAWLEEPLASAIQAIWRQGKWLPQEALGFEKLQQGVIRSVDAHQPCATYQDLL
ncbi:Wadjet anti-phage system protein JetD domain-containing protein [Variovorax sp. NFACC27]|uniref:Wadjet anti-phage system protein JetD domain-containing protein n=1 Tax=unclassified Variovorax TaxID=663243 RepID=UPI000898C827|nr:hypothetical protein SAMN03159371_00887 [Variovorax sp. NFACC28]SEG07756.1 hypothetical protein SAMN03159365_01354 [Variovorax sp. NFACC29]SFC02160.1 hypothetical protein SAMN03159379_01353 [Variovorax sp. NFACC26]SFF78171.1 hypothetical protein SAMN03159447_00070 [Variovorax sp. NFACC27]